MNFKLCLHCKTERDPELFVNHPDRCQECIEKNIIDLSIVGLKDNEVSLCKECKCERPLHSFIFDKGEYQDSCLDVPCQKKYKTREKSRINTANWRLANPERQRLAQQKQDAKRIALIKDKGLGWNRSKRDTKELSTKLRRDIAKLRLQSANTNNYSFDDNFEVKDDFNSIVMSFMNKE